MSIPSHLCSAKKPGLISSLFFNNPLLMEAEKVLNSYDWIWFHRQIFQKEPTFSFLSSSEDNPDIENGLISISLSLSPNSVLGSPFSEATNSKTTTFKEASKKASRRRRLERKSLSELEFEEVKGFKDLGFVFSEKDRNNSELASVIPGSNRLGFEEEVKGILDDEESRITRPYLSEVWEVLDMDRRRSEEIMSPLLKNWKLPSFNSEIDMKQNLMWWAHTVASTVR